MQSSYRKISPERRLENIEISAAAAQLATEADAVVGNTRADELLAEAQARIDAAGGLHNLSKREVDQLWALHMRALRLRRG
jgi:hypothetical protein